MPVKLTDKEFRNKVYEAHQGKIIPLLRIKFSRMSDYNKVKLLYEKQVKDFLSVYNLIP